jgi:hypothetical protein
VSRAATGFVGCVALCSLTPAAVHAAVHADVHADIHTDVAQTHRGAHQGVHQKVDSDDSPLRISITGLTPGVLPRTGPLVVTGTVTNVDTVDWTDVNLYPTLDTDSCVAVSGCAAPMTSADALADGAASDPADPVGVRVTDVQDTIATLAPGQATSFRLSIPQDVLRSEIASPQPGVYWFGVQAIGQSSETPRDSNSDGRARTFLPYVPEGFGADAKGRHASVLDTAIVVPVRAPIRHLRDGRIGGARKWLASLSPTGSLGGALAVGAASGGLPVTWLVDPAVPDAVRQLADGNPARLVAAPGQEPSASPSATSLSTGDTGTTDDPLAAAASTWLNDAHRDFGSGELLALPYGDPQLIGSPDTAPLYRTARAERGVLADWKLPSRRAIGSPDGYLDPDGLAAVKDRSVALVGDQMLRRQVAGGTLGTHPFVATSSAAAEGGPGPNDQHAAINVRQRILSEAAVRLISGEPRPLVVQLPAEMGSGHAEAFWSGLSQSWLHLTDVRSVLRSAGALVEPDHLRARHARASDQYAALAQTEARELMSTGDLLQSIVTSPHGTDLNAHLATTVTREALAGTSYSLQDDQYAAARLTRSRIWMLDQLSGVTLSAPPGVTLSSSEGSFSVTVTNTLDVPVAVRIAATAEGAHVNKTDQVALAAHSRASVRLDAHTERAGVHNVSLALTDDDGTPIGSSVVVPIRSGSVGVVIWAILGSGAGILLVAIVIRLRRRFLNYRSGGAA